MTASSWHVWCRFLWPWKHLLRAPGGVTHAELLMEGILHQLIWRISHFSECFIDSRWCRISSINSTAVSLPIHVLKKPLYKGYVETNATTTNAYMNILLTASTRMLVQVYFKNQAEIDPPVLRTSASFHTLSHLGSANIT